MRRMRHGLRGLGDYPPVYITEPDGNIYVQPGTPNWGTVQYIDSTGATQMMTPGYVVSSASDGTEIVQANVPAWPVAGAMNTKQTQGPYSSLIAAMSSVAPVTPVSQVAPVGAPPPMNYATNGPYTSPYYAAPQTTLLGFPLLYWAIGLAALMVLRK